MDDREEMERMSLLAEFRRVGITGAAFVELDRRNAGPNALGTPPDGSVNLELDIPATIELLRSLPDGAGQEAFLAAWDKRFGEPARQRFEVARRKWEQKHRRSTGPSGGAA